MQWVAAGDGKWKSGVYRIYPNSRLEYSLWIDRGDGLQLLNQDCDSVRSAKALAEHHKEGVGA